MPASFPMSTGLDTPTLDAAGLSTAPSGQSSSGSPASPKGNPGSGNGRPGPRPAAVAMTGGSLDGTQATVDSILAKLNNLPIGALNAQLSIGVGATFGIVSLAGDVILKGSISHDDDRRVRATVGVGFKVAGELDLKVWKASASVERTFSGTYVFRSPRHFAMWILKKINDFQKAVERYVKAKAGPDTNGQQVQGKKIPAVPAGTDTDPSMSITKDATVNRVAIDTKKEFAGTGVLKGLEGSATFETFTATRKDKKTGKTQQLEGWKAAGEIGVASRWGSIKAEYSFTKNHPNPDQDGVFVDLWFSPGTTASSMRDKKIAAAVAVGLSAFTPDKSKPLVYTAQALGSKVGALLTAESSRTTGKDTKAAKKLEGKPFDLHAQYNYDQRGVSTRFVRVESTASVDLQGSIPIGATGLQARLGFKASAMVGVLEAIGTQTTLYVQNVYNGLKSRATFAKEWARWVSGHRLSLWQIFQSVNQAGSTASKEVSGGVRSAAAKYTQQLSTANVDSGAFDAMLKALTAHFDAAGNTAKGWHDVAVDAPTPGAPPPPPVKWADATITGATGGKATLAGGAASGDVPAIKTLRDLYKKNWKLRLDAPSIASRRRGSLNFKGRGSALKADFQRTLKIIFMHELEMSPTLWALLPREIANDPPRKMEYEDMKAYLPMLDRILDSDASQVEFTS